MKISRPEPDRGTGAKRAFTLMEVAMCMFIAMITCGAIMKCYVLASRRSLWASCSLAANAMVMKQVEQAMGANWILGSGTVELFSLSTNVTTANLEMPISQTNVVYCTNYISITQLSTNPPYAMIKVNCVWSFMDLGVFTNSVAVIRGPNR